MKNVDNNKEREETLQNDLTKMRKNADDERSGDEETQEDEETQNEEWSDDKER